MPKTAIYQQSIWKSIKYGYSVDVEYSRADNVLCYLTACPDVPAVTFERDTFLKKFEQIKPGVRS